jgi:hypothetical protein
MSARITASLFGAALALIVTAGSAAEDIRSANFVMPGCQSLAKNESVDAVQQGICAGGVNAIVVMAGTMKSTLDADPDRTGMLHSLIRDRMCIDVPSTATPGQAIRVVIAYIEARPARIHEDFNILALEALRTAWPCRP